MGCDLPVDKWLVIYLWTNGLWFTCEEVGCDLPVDKWACGPLSVRPTAELFQGHCRNFFVRDED